MPGFLKALKAELPRIEVEQRPATAGLPLDALRRGEVDLELAHWRVPPRGLATLPLFRDELVAVLPSGHALARQPRLAAADFLTEPYVTYSTVIEPGLENDLVFTPARAWPTRFLRAGTAEAALALHPSQPRARAAAASRAAGSSNSAKQVAPLPDMRASRTSGAAASRASQCLRCG